MTSTTTELNHYSNTSVFLAHRTLEAQVAHVQDGSQQLGDLPVLSLGEHEHLHGWQDAGVIVQVVTTVTRCTAPLQDKTHRDLCLHCFSWRSKDVRLWWNATFQQVLVPFWERFSSTDSPWWGRSSLWRGPGPAWPSSLEPSLVAYSKICGSSSHLDSGGRKEIN